MKFSNSSPSFSSCSSSLSTITSTTTTIASDVPLCTSKSATTGCLTGIFRRILRYGSSPTYPSDHITEGAKESNCVESCKDQAFKSYEKTEDKETIANPGIVARLMGLESIPNSISRSKSMDFVDRFAGFDDPMQVQHRRVKSTHSFREMPTFLQLESEEKFFVLSFENGTKNKEFRSKGRNSENGCGELKPKRGGKRETNDNKAAEKKKKKKFEEEKGRRALKDLNGREMLRSKISSANGIDKDSTSTSIRKKAIKRKKKTICDVLKSVELECSSEDLSPVSVFDFDQFLVDQEVPTSDQEDSGLLCARRTKTTRKGKCLGSRKKLCKSAEHIEMWSEICRLTEEELVGSNWIAQHNKGMWNNSQQGSASAGIGADFESQLLGQLVDELVDQFSAFYS